MKSLDIVEYSVGVWVNTLIDDFESNLSKEFMYSTYTFMEDVFNFRSHVYAESDEYRYGK